MGKLIMSIDGKEYPVDGSVELSVEHEEASAEQLIEWMKELHQRLYEQAGEKP